MRCIVTYPRGNGRGSRFTYSTALSGQIRSLSLRSMTEGRPGPPAPKVDHFAIGVDNFNKDSVSADLKTRGANPIDQQGGNFGFHVLDSDGFPVQISAN